MKERLTGAIVLVVLIVLLVPELLSGPKGSAVTPPAPGVAPPSSEEPPLRSYTINLGDDSHSQSRNAGSATVTNGPAMPQPSEPAQPTTQSTSSQAVPSDSAASGANASANEASASAPSGSDQSVDEQSSWDSPAAMGKTSGTQAANTRGAQESESSVSSAAQADRPGTATQGYSSAPQSAASSQMHSANSVPAPSQAHPATSTPASSNGHQPSRTARDGSLPRKTAASATAARGAEKPLAAAKKPARVAQANAMAEKPAKVGQANTTAGSESGSWGVQLGVFGSRENAERLALDVRTKGFKATVSPVAGGPRKLYRVRVGPAADRSAAQELQGRLKAAGRPGGTVVPYS